MHAQNRKTMEEWFFCFGDGSAVYFAGFYAIKPSALWGKRKLN